MASKITAEDRRSLAEKLDADIDQMFEDAIKKNADKPKEEFSEEAFNEVLNSHPAFMNRTPTQEEIDQNPLLQGLQQLKYDDDDETPENQALAYKDDGNWHFKHKLYAKAVRAYTGGLLKKHSDNELTCTLYANRAAAHFYLKNFRSSYLDSMEALKLQPNKIKSLMRCAQCCSALSKHSDAIVWLKKTLSVNPQQSAAKEMLQNAQRDMKMADRDKRKREREESARCAKTKALIEAIRGRGIKLNAPDMKETAADDHLSLEDALICRSVDNGNPSHAKVHFENDSVADLAGSGRLVWPVLFTYPEHEVSEIIEQFSEDNTFLDHLEIMFEERAPWDEESNYALDNLEVYHEFGVGCLRFVDASRTLQDVLSGGEIVVTAGTPVFVVLCKVSPYRNIFLSKYSVRH